VAAELAGAHGGSLQARSEPGRGAQLILTLPRA
jgi:signal transduction histidine kinase